jgi:hypothetical protein
MSISMATSKPGRVITDAEREALKALSEHREELKNEYNSRRVVAVRKLFCTMGFAHLTS